MKISIYRWEGFDFPSQFLLDRFGMMIGFFYNGETNYGVASQSPIKNLFTNS